MSAVLQRESFVTSRLMDFFSEKELVTQTGHAKSHWPAVILKELVDNALDRCEDTGTAPEISVSARIVARFKNERNVAWDQVVAQIAAMDED